MTSQAPPTETCAEAPDVAIAYARHPGLGAWHTSAETTTRDNLVGIHLPGAGFNVNHDVIAIATWFNPSANIAIIDFAPKPSRVLFCVASD
jgi:hypothetical protein